ncbi:aldo-keto reductase-like protein [Xylogone sp. PMI_703]|nr:aldo-keto reductase-like protein [Xylogone sp. PMI_703]
MEYTRLGNSGLKISKVILGAMSFGSSKIPGQEWILEEEQALPLLKHAYDVGINTWDTADLYSYGKSEEIIGKALKEYQIPRNRVVILTKCYFGVPEAEDGEVSIPQIMSNDGILVNRVGLSRKHIFDAVERSVERLGTYIDVLQIHRLDKETPREEIMKALNDVVESGKVRYIGASSMAAWEFQALQNVAEKHGWHKFISMQNYYNLLYREEGTLLVLIFYYSYINLFSYLEREMIPYCRDAGIGLIPWSPMARGALARPFTSRSTIREQSDVHLKALIRAQENQTDKSIIDRVEELAKKKGVTMATIATAWCLYKGVNPIVGLSSKERIDQVIENIKFASNGGLTKEDVEYLEEHYIPKQIQGY